ncbi:hypothetical protein IFM89_017050 [Coptis chinensis]|uniref:CCHC-type domain-containing protein n=1 Tax=Coptis chinensis TaxID=261450 RepID=A0A835HI59_9MAGN|nr:hypothetical protein IFM89_017050 [Coptis chinensis]
MLQMANHIFSRSSTSYGPNEGHPKDEAGKSKASVSCLKLHSYGVPKRVVCKFRNLFYLMADPLKTGNGEKTNLYHVNDDMAKQITSMKLNGQNYLPWAHAHSMEPQVASNVQFLDSSKKIWLSLQDSYSQEKNISRIYKIFEMLFATKQVGRPLAEDYSTFKGLREELILYQPFSGDVEVQKAQREEFHVALLLYGPDPEYKVFKDQILAGEKLPTSSNAFSRLSRASVEHSTPLAPFEASALISSAENRGGSHSGSRGGGRSGSRGGGCSGGRGDRVGHGAIFFPSGRGLAPREDRKCNFCGKIGHTEDYCWDKHGKPAYANQVSCVTPPVATASRGVTTSEFSASATSPDVSAQIDQII